MSSPSAGKREDPIPAAGNAVTVERSYYRIRKETVKDGSVKDTQTDAGELVSQGRDLTRRTLLKNGDVIASGDIIEVVMTVKTKNDVEYLMLLDPSPQAVNPGKPPAATPGWEPFPATGK